MMSSNNCKAWNVVAREEKADLKKVYFIVYANRWLEWNSRSGETEVGGDVSSTYVD